MGALGLVLTLAGTAVEAVGAYEQGQAVKQAANANARYVAMESAAEQERVHRMASRVQAENVTRIAKSGVTLSGSPLQVLATNARETSRQVNSMIRASVAQQNLLHREGQNAVEAARWKMASGILRGVGGGISGSTDFQFAGGGWGFGGSGLKSGVVPLKRG